MVSIDFNAYLTGPASPQLNAGDVVHGPFRFRHPAPPIDGTGLSNGVTFTMCP